MLQGFQKLQLRRRPWDGHLNARTTNAWNTPMLQEPRSNRSELKAYEPGSKLLIRGLCRACMGSLLRGYPAVYKELFSLCLTWAGVRSPGAVARGAGTSREEELGISLAQWLLRFSPGPYPDPPGGSEKRNPQITDSNILPVV